eukprot:1148391-Pelagomonas_calceolata.AAC.3
MGREDPVVGQTQNLAIFLWRNSSTTGAKNVEDVSKLYRSYRNILSGVKTGPRVELWAVFWSSEARRGIWGPPIFMKL